MGLIPEIIFNKLYAAMLFLINLFQDWFYKANGKFESSAKIYRIVYRYRETYNFGFANKGDFIGIFEEFEHPSIVLEDNYSLYTITDEEAIFVDCGEFDLFHKDVAFVILTQLVMAKKMIVMPLSSFHMIANQITLPNVPILNIGNHARCGSTLVTKIFHEVPKTFVVAETMSFTKLSEMSFSSGNRDYEKIKKLLFSVLLMTFKHAIKRESKFIVMKCQCFALFITDIMMQCFPKIKQIYLYRQPADFIRSYEKIISLNKWESLYRKERSLYWAGFGEHRLMKNIVQSVPLDFFDELSFNASKLALTWITSAAAFKELIKCGFPIQSVKYDHLVSNPEEETRKLFMFVGIPLNLLPDINKVFAKDSQAGTPLSTRNEDKELLKKIVTPITVELKTEITGLCHLFKIDDENFWSDEVLLQSRLN